MAPDQVLALDELAHALVWLSFLGGIVGAIAYRMGTGALYWLVDRLPVTKKYRDYQVACLLARQQVQANRVKLKASRVRSRG